LTGENAGCYALADVISGVDTVPEEPYESLYYTSEEQKEEREEEDRIKIQITHNLVDNPILWTSIRDLPEFKDFKGGNQGTNFRASEEEYETLLRMHEPNYWLFQGNPEIYDINEALRAEHLKSWKVAAHKKRIRTGDKVILWQTGNQAGCYALADVISEVGKIMEEDTELQYYLSQEDRTPTKPIDRVKIRVTLNLVDNPILWADIKDYPEFKGFKG